MIDEQAYERMRDRVYQLQAQVDFLYRHLGITYVPETASNDDPRIIEQLKKGNILAAMKVHRELFGSDLNRAREAVLEMKGRLGI